MLWGSVTWAQENISKMDMPVSSDKLSDDDRKAIIQIARDSLARFQPKPEAAPKDKT